MNGAYEIIECQNCVIKMQADVIYELFGFLAQHVDPDELDSLPPVKKINAAAEIRDKIRILYKEQ